MKKLRIAGAAAYAGLGVAGLTVPERIPAYFGGSAPTPQARNEIRAVYGGMPLAIALLALGGGRSTRAAALLTAGMAAGRAYGAGQEGDMDDTTKLWLGVEAGLTAALLLGSAGVKKAVV